jgi:DNA mismatch repair protein MutS
MTNDDLTPIRRQYLHLKSQYPDSILFFRLGDFYETFDADAELIARELDIVLTSRPVGKGQRVPLAGVPYHAANTYIARLIEKGYRVAVAEQLADPSTVKGIVPRDVTRVVTPGTVIEPELLDEKRPSYLAAWISDGQHAGIAYADVTTGEFAATQLDSISAGEQELLRILPRECLIQAQSDKNREPVIKPAVNAAPIHFTPLAAWHFENSQARQAVLDHFQVATLAGFGLDRKPLAVRAAGAILHYLKETQAGALAQFTSLRSYSTGEFMALDPATRRNLELTDALHGKDTRSLSLLGVIDVTRTAMGSRLIRSWLSQPLLDRSALEQRLDRVQSFFDEALLRAKLRDLLKGMPDLERAVGRVISNHAAPRDLAAIRTALQSVPTLAAVLKQQPGWLLDPVSDILDLLQRAIVDEPAASPPGVIQPGFSAELDGVLQASRNAKEWVANLERTEKERTGIKSLKVGYNKVFGYYIEVTHANTQAVPDNYIRKQTLTNAERYITPELKEYETLILNADERLVEIEQRLFKEICAQISARSAVLLSTARTIAQLDVTSALAEVAALNRYVRPELTDENALHISGGRHPVVEKALRETRFVPNDVTFDDEARVLIITGPNMSGKCVRADTLVFTDQGVLTIESLQPCAAEPDTFVPVQYLIKGLAGVAQADHFYVGGKRATIRIRTRLGYEVEGTLEHRIWVRQPSGTETWKALSDIAPGDVVAIDRQIDLWGRDEALTTPRALELRPRATLKLYSLPKQLTPDLAYLMGLLIGDGSLREQNMLSLTTGDTFIAEEFKRIVSELFGYRAQRLAKSKHFDYRVTSRQIRLFFEECGLDYVTALDKQIPRCILRASKPVVRAFLQGLFDTDGTADAKGNVSLSTSSLLLAQQVHVLMLNFGIISSLQRKKGVRSANANYTVTIYGAEALAFYQEIGFRLPRKQAGQQRVSHLRMPNVGGIPYLPGDLKRIQARIVAKTGKPQALKKNKSINSIFYTYLPTGRNISYFKLEELQAYCRQNDVPCPELDALAQRRYFYDPIVEVSSGEANVFDLSVTGCHSFVANGFVNHNSTYLRQVALIVLMAQIGSFVPADQARIGLADRIFTRIGAQDDIATGQSTFMVEMVETANILHHASARSLIVLDEIGRGTSTYDGLSIAWAVVEYIHNHPRLRAKTLFATHYHELIQLADHLPHVRNYNVAVAEEGDRVVFLHHIVPGGADRSYGIHVAQLAGLPKPVIRRAEELLEELEQSQRDHATTAAAEDAPLQLSLFGGKNPVLEELEQLDVNALSPLEALNKLFEWKKKA